MAVDLCLSNTPNYRDADFKTSLHLSGSGAYLFLRRYFERVRDQIHLTVDEFEDAEFFGDDLDAFLAILREAQRNAETMPDEQRFNAYGDVHIVTRGQVVETIERLKQLAEVAKRDHLYLVSVAD